MIAIANRTHYLYYDQTPFQTNIRSITLGELLLQFESDVISKLNLLTKVCTSNANLYEVCTMCNNLRRWIDFNSRELKFLCLKDTQRNFHARFYGIVEPLL